MFSFHLWECSDRKKNDFATDLIIKQLTTWYKITNLLLCLLYVTVNSLEERFKSISEDSDVFKFSISILVVKIMDSKTVETSCHNL
jgi:hypothetical protein